LKEGRLKFKTLIASVAFIALCTAVAGAADLAVKAPSPPPPVFSWTGFYIGANIGGCPYRKSDPEVLMVQSAENWPLCVPKTLSGLMT
jgi:hypothetical protein